MNGETPHEHYMLEPLEQDLKRHGATVTRQMKSRSGPGGGYADLFARMGSIRLVIEVEMTSRRIANDLIKAADLDAWLWVVVPNGKVAQAVRRRLKRLHVRPREPWIFVLTLPQALQQITNYCSIVVPVIDKEDNKQQNVTGTSPGQPGQCPAALIPKTSFS